jgi:hypothetical protein
MLDRIPILRVRRESSTGFGKIGASDAGSGVITSTGAASSERYFRRYTTVT